MDTGGRYRTLPRPVRRLGRRLLIARHQIPNVRRYGSLRSSPLVSVRHVLFNRELTNFTYEIENAGALVALLAEMLGADRDRLAALSAELQEDDRLGAELAEKLRHRLDRNRRMPFGRRIGWYILVRVLRPRLVVETGTHDGLGSTAVLAALERNAADGSDGRLISIDVDPSTGWLVPDRLRGRYEQLHGDSVEVLERIDDRIDLAILDSAHVYDHELRELELLRAKAGAETVFVSDNPGTNSLADFADEHGLSYSVFRERSLRHIHPAPGSVSPSRAGRLLPDRVERGRCDLGDLVVGVVGRERQAEHPSGQALGNGEAAVDGELGVGGLPVDRRRVVDAGADPGLLEPGAQLVAARRLDDVEVVGMLAARTDGRRHERAAGERGVVARGELAPACIGGVEMGELRGEDRRLQGVEPAVQPPQHVFEAMPLAVVAQQPRPLGDGVVGGHDRAARRRARRGSSSGRS